MRYDWIAVAALIGLIVSLLFIIRLTAEVRNLKNRVRYLYRKARQQRETDQALLASARNTIDALDTDFDEAIKLSVEQMVYWRGVARGLAREIKDEPGFESHIKYPVENCVLCSLVRQAEQS